jgi:asparagine N-glycosylation enzyme membrane subunit Stt3
MTQASEQILAAPEVEQPRSALRQLLALKPVQIALAFAITVAVMGFIETGGPAILDNDGYYHMQWSKKLLESFPALPAFDALPMTTLAPEDYVDHHYLFHLMLAPFTIGDMRVGAKLAAVVFSSLGIVSLFALLVAYRVPYRWFWLAPLIASSEPFLYRMSMTRAPAASLAMLGLGTYIILKRKWIWLAVISFAFVWLYSLFPLILAITLLHAAAVYMSERRIEWRGAAASISGILAGLLINPYFPKNLSLFYDHLVMKLTPESGYTVDVGVEWYPYDSWILIMSSAIAFALFVGGLMAFNFRERARDLKPLFFLMVSVMLLLMLIKSRRFVEYWPPFAVLFAAFTISPRLKEIDFTWFAKTRDKVIGVVAAGLVALAALLYMGGTVWTARQSVAGEANPYAYEGASKWIAENTPAGSMVFNTDWDDFPMLYYYNPRNAYVAGLDPTYLYDRDPELWDLYARITLGRIDDPAPLIRERYGAEIVFTDNHHTLFLGIAERSGDFETVYKDQYTTVLRLKPAAESITQ